MPATTTYAGPMPISATPPAPVTAPNTRAVSDVVRERPSAPSSISPRIVCPTSTCRITMSEGRSRPASAAITNTCHGRSAPARVSAARTAASTAYTPRVMQSRVRCPIRSPSRPKKGENSEPSQPSAATDNPPAAAPSRWWTGCTTRGSAPPSRTPTTWPGRPATGNESCERRRVKPSPHATSSDAQPPAGTLISLLDRWQSARLRR